MLTFYDVTLDKYLDMHNDSYAHYKRATQVKHQRQQINKLKSIPNVQRDSVKSMVALRDDFFKRKYKQFESKQSGNIGPNFLQRMKNDEERRKLDHICTLIK